MQLPTLSVVNLSLCARLQVGALPRRCNLGLQNPRRFDRFGPAGALPSTPPGHPKETRPLLSPTACHGCGTRAEQAGQAAKRLTDFFGFVGQGVAGDAGPQHRLDERRELRPEDGQT